MTTARPPSLKLDDQPLAVERLTPTAYRVASRSRPGRVYPVLLRADGWHCACEASAYYGRCAHIASVEADVRARRHPCPRCGQPMRRLTRRYAGNDYRTAWECTAWWENPTTGQIESCATGGAL